MDTEAGSDAVVIELLEQATDAAESAGTWASSAAADAAQALANVRDLAAEVRELQASLDDAVELLVDILRSRRLEGDHPDEALGFTERQIRDAVTALRKRLDRAPTREEAAAELHTSVSTLRRAMILLGMRRGWPPAPPAGAD